MGQRAQGRAQADGLHVRGVRGEEDHPAGGRGQPQQVDLVQPPPAGPVPVAAQRHAVQEQHVPGQVQRVDPGQHRLGVVRVLGQAAEHQQVRARQAAPLALPTGRAQQFDRQLHALDAEHPHRAQDHRPVQVEPPLAGELVVPVGEGRAHLGRQHVRHHPRRQVGGVAGRLGRQVRGDHRPPGVAVVLGDRNELVGRGRVQPHAVLEDRARAEQVVVPEHDAARVPARAEPVPHGRVQAGGDRHGVGERHVDRDHPVDVLLAQPRGEVLPIDLGQFADALAQQGAVGLGQPLRVGHGRADALPLVAQPGRVGGGRRGDHPQPVRVAVDHRATGVEPPLVRAPRVAQVGGHRRVDQTVADPEFPDVAEDRQQSAHRKSVAGHHSQSHRLNSPRERAGTPLDAHPFLVGRVRWSGVRSARNSAAVRQKSHCGEPSDNHERIEDGKTPGAPLNSAVPISRSARETVVPNCFRGRVPICT